MPQEQCSKHRPHTPDCLSNVKGSRLIILVINPFGKTIIHSIKRHSIANNEDEHKVVVAELELAKKIGEESIELKNDS